MRLRIGLVLGTIAIVLVLSALPATWYHVNVVGPNFIAAMEVQQDPADVEVRQLEGECGLSNYHISDSSWQQPPPLMDDPMTVVPMYDNTEEPGPNDNLQEVYQGTTVAVSAAVFALIAGAFGAWNIAKHDRFRWFTAASFALAAILLVGGCVYFSSELPDAMAADAANGHEDTFGVAFEPYIDPEGGEPGYYTEFSGGYPDNNPRNREQLQYGAGAGWWLAGAGGVLALITAGLFVGAPQWHSLRKEKVVNNPVEVVRYIPVPTVTDMRPRRRYPRRMPAVSRNSTNNYKR